MPSPKLKLKFKVGDLVQPVRLIAGAVNLPSGTRCEVMEVFSCKPRGQKRTERYRLERYHDASGSHEATPEPNWWVDADAVEPVGS